MESFAGDVGFCACAVTPYLDLLMVAAFCIFLLSGFPVAFSLGEIGRASCRERV